MQYSRRPEYNLVLATKDHHPGTGKRIYTQVGVAWDVFEGGGIAIKLNPGTCIDWRMMDDFYLTMFKNNDQNWNVSKGISSKKPGSVVQGGSFPDDVDDLPDLPDIPF